MDLILISHLIEIDAMLSNLRRMCVNAARTQAESALTALNKSDPNLQNVFN